jgi:cell division protein FtsL
MKLSGVLTHRVRGFRVVDLVALTVFLALALAVYAFKTSAGRERTDIADVEQQIRDETRQVKLLQGEIAHLESPERLERIATRYAGLGPVTAKQEIPPEALPQVASPAVTAAPAASNQTVTP